MDVAQSQSLHRRARGTSWYADLADLAASLRQARSLDGRLLVVGDPDDQPWHLTAHLDMFARYRCQPELAATLAGERDLLQAGDDDTVLFVSQRTASPLVLQQLDDARGRGSAVLGLCTDDEELAGVAQHCVRLGTAPLHLDGLVAGDFEVATHVFGVAAGRRPPRLSWRGRRR